VQPFFLSFVCSLRGGSAVKLKCPAHVYYLVCICKQFQVSALYNFGREALCCTDHL